MSTRPYPAYRAARSEWLDFIPDHWSEGTLRWLSKRYAGGTPDKAREDYWTGGTIPWLNSGSVNQGLIQKPSAFITEDAFANSSARWVPAGALVIALAGQGKTKGMVAQLALPSTCNQSMAAIVPNAELVARFLYWWLSSNYQNLRNMAGGDNRDGLNLELLGNVGCPIPAPEEQATIAAFLDRETGKIDALVEAQQRLIELLKEKRQAVISHAVTKGLDPTDQMKDSGVEWLGEVPSHWEALRFSRHFKVGMGQTILAENLVDGGTIPVFSATEEDRFFGYIDATGLILKPGDLVIPARGNSIGHVKLVKQIATSTQTTIYAKAADLQLTQPEYVFWFLKSNRKRLFPFTQTAIPQITTAEVGANPILLPPPTEQTEIVRYVEEVDQEFGALMKEAESAIILLQERRAALISAAVTGKIDVRGLAPEKADAA